MDVRARRNSRTAIARAARSKKASARPGSTPSEPDIVAILRPRPNTVKRASPVPSAFALRASADKRPYLMTSTTTLGAPFIASLTAATSLEMNPLTAASAFATSPVRSFNRVSSPSFGARTPRLK